MTKRCVHRGCHGNREASGGNSRFCCRYASSGALVYIRQLQYISISVFTYCILDNYLNTHMLTKYRRYVSAVQYVYTSSFVMVLLYSDTKKLEVMLLKMF